MSSIPTDISSEVDIAAVESNDFDKQQLISWASKLELESIDYRTSSIDLMEALAKISKSLTDSLKSVDSHIYHLRSESGQKELKLKDFIEVTISEELDLVYSRISTLYDKLKQVQDLVVESDNQQVQKLQAAFNKLEADSDYKYKMIVQKLAILEESQFKRPEFVTPGATPIRLQTKDKVTEQKQPELQIVVRQQPDTSPVVNKRAATTVTRKATKRRRNQTMTRRLIFD